MKSANLPPVCYTSLSQNAIRLFSLDQHDSDVLSGRIEILHVNETPPYSALSYCWGQQEKDVPIIVNGQTLSVSPNLGEALRRLREMRLKDSDMSAQITWIWIDQICINQSDAAERAEQVQLMASIYSQSIRTIIWIGEDVNHCSSAWDLVDQIYCVFKKQNPNARSIADIPFRIYSDEGHAASGLPDWENPQWHQLRRLLGLPWFTRIWVVQEVVLSPLNPIILHGQRKYPWFRISWAATWLRRNGYIRLSQVPNQFQNVDAMSNIKMSPVRWTIDVLLSTTSIKFQATDQRDKVYGLLGIAAETQDPRNVPVELRPDYGLDVPQVYQRTVMFLLRKYRTLASLSRTSEHVNDLSHWQQKYVWNLMPSWVPNWGDFIVLEREVAKCLSWISHPKTTDRPTLGFPIHYKASSGLPVQIYGLQQKSRLRLRGLRVDTVVQAVQMNGVLVQNAADISKRSTMRIWKTASPLLPDLGAMNWIVSFAKSTTADHHEISGRTDEQLLSDASAYLLSFLLDAENQAAGSLSRQRCPEIIEVLGELSVGGSADIYAALSANFCLNRSFFITSERRMGIGPLGTDIGDTVAVLFGGGVPYVLREQDHGMLFVGESYIQGLMEGEGVQAWQSGKVEQEIFELV